MGGGGNGERVEGKMRGRFEAGPADMDSVSMDNSDAESVCAGLGAGLTGCGWVRGLGSEVKGE